MGGGYALGGITGSTYLLREAYSKTMLWLPELLLLTGIELKDMALLIFNCGEGISY